MREEQELSVKEEVSISEAVKNKLIDLGRKLERKRIYDLEQLAPDNSGDELYRAKFTNPMEPEKFAVALVGKKAYKNKNYKK